MPHGQFVARRPLIGGWTMREFQPDYRHVENAARNREASRLPLYEHLVDFGKIGGFYHRNWL